MRSSHRFALERSARSIGCQLFIALCLGLGAGNDFNSTRVHGADQYVIRNWQTEEGLPQDSGTALAQTSDGYLWVGTFNGLVRFNGMDFTRFTIANTKAFYSDDINVLFEDRSGRLWIGTYIGLVCYERGEFKRWNDPPLLSRAIVRDVGQHPDGSILVATDRGIWRIAQGQAEEILIPNPKWPTYHSYFARGPQGEIWLAHREDLYLFQGQSIEWKFSFSEYISALAAGRDGSIWCGLHLQIVRWRPGWAAPEHLFNLEAPRALLESLNGDWWVGSAGVGLHRWRKGEVLAVPLSSESAKDRVLRLLEDREGNLWVGADGGGFSRVRESQMVTYGPEHGISYFDVISILEDKTGHIWLGTFGGSISIGRNATWYPLQMEGELDPKEGVIALCQTPDGTIWVGRKTGPLCRIRNGRVELEPRSQVGSVRALLVDRFAGVWAGSEDNGVEYFRDGEVRRWNRSNGLSDNFISALAEDAEGAVWIGTGEGLNRVVDGVIQRYYRKDGLGADLIHSLFVDSQGTVWIGTAGAGLTRYRNGQFSTVNSNQGLQGDVVAQILEDDFGYLWIGSTTGIFRVDLSLLHAVLDGQAPILRGTVFGKKDGMRAAGCAGGFHPTSLKSSDGLLWFCTSEGVTVVDPAKLQRAELPPPVHIERLVIDGVQIESEAGSSVVLASGMPPEWDLPENWESQSRFVRSHVRASSALPQPELPAHGAASERAGPGDPIVVAPGSRRVEIHCAALSLSAPLQTQYSFWLEGYEETWQEAGTRRVAYYSKVPPGLYTFHVKAANADGVWNPSVASLSLHFLPVWWQTGWFRFGLLMMVTGALGFLYHNRVSDLKRARLRQTDFSRQLIASQELERKRIAAELHDSLGQSLVVIKNRAKLGLNDPQRAGGAAEQLQEIANLASQAVEEVRGIAQNLRPYQLDRLGLTRALQFLLQSVSASSSIRIVDEIEIVDRLFPAEAEIHIFRIAQEFLNNVVKYSQASEIRVTVRREPEKVFFGFEDNGRGFDNSADFAGGGKFGGFGLQSMAERLRIIGGQAEFHTLPGEGTRLRFTLQMPGASSRSEIKKS